ncbi:MAG TPA: hypothetical protein VNV63_00040, partial [Nitrospiria bacterium]|nr:hypothetical protein [Nitrospiria bacterium]
MVFLRDAEKTLGGQFGQSESMEREQLPRPLLIFDGDCSFCRAWVEYWKDLTGDHVGYTPLQEVGDRFPRVSHQEFTSAVQLVLNDEVRSG